MGKWALDKSCSEPYAPILEDAGARFTCMLTEKIFGMGQCNEQCDSHGVMVWQSSTMSNYDHAGSMCNLLHVQRSCSAGNPVGSANV